MEKSSVQNVKLGIFVIAAICLFVGGTWLIGDKQHLFGNMVSVYSVFPNTNGLREGNNVRYSGINVGTVKQITLINDTTIVVELSIQGDITRHMKKDARAAITSDGLVGNMIVNILHGTATARPLVRGDTIPSISRIRTDEMLQTLSVTNENAAVLTANLIEITAQISRGEGVVAALLSDKAMADDVKATLRNLHLASKEAMTAARNVNRTIASLDNDNTLIGVMKDTVVSSSLRTTSENAAEASARLVSSMVQLESALRQVDGFVANLREGKGTLQAFTNDPRLAADMRRTVTDLDSTLLSFQMAGDRINETLAALRYHWLMRGAFKKMEKKKTRE